MAKAKRPVFIPLPGGYPFVKELSIEFEWFPGFAVTQAQKSIASWHLHASRQGIKPVLEISSKSPDRLGVSLSAFNLQLEVPGQPHRISVECAFQGSKVFQKGGPFSELYFVSSKEAKTDPRLRSSGDLTGFEFFGEPFPTKPINAFYDWLYIVALSQNQALASQVLSYQGFTDIAYNPKKSWNCQARSAALFVALSQAGLLEQAVRDRAYYLDLITNQNTPAKPPGPSQQLKLF